MAADDAGKHASGGLLQDTSLWVLLAFALVVFGLWKAGLPKTMMSGLDSRAQKIADELDEARRLREEAQELLATYQRRHRDAEHEAATIIEQAKKDAARMATEAREKIDAQTARRIKSAEEKIARAEEQAISEVRGKAAELAVSAAEHIIRDRMDAGAQTAFVDRAIASLRTDAARQ